MYVCICRQVTDNRISQEIANGAKSMRELSKRLGVASQCGKCGQCVKQMLNAATCPVQPCSGC